MILSFGWQEERGEGEEANPFKYHLDHDNLVKQAHSIHLTHKRICHTKAPKIIYNRAKKGTLITSYNP